MPSLQESLSQILGRSIDIERGSHYALLGIAEFESDRKVVADAYNSIVQELKSKRSQFDPTTWEAIIPLMQQLKTTLLDPQRKLEYDRSQRIKKMQAPESALSGAKSQKAETSTQSSRPEKAWGSVFPEGDPSEPFNMGRYVETQSDPSEPEESIDHRLETLRQELQIASLDWDTPIVSTQTQDAASVELPTRSFANPSTPSRKRRKTSNHSTFWIAGTLLVGSISLVAVGGWMAYQNWIESNKGKNPSVVQVADQKPRKEDRKGTDSTKQPVKNGSKFEVDSSKFDIPSTPNEQASPQENALAMNGQSMEKPSPPPTPPNGEMPMVPNTNPPAPAPMPTPTPTPEPPPAPMPLNAAEKASLVRSLKDLRKSIEAWDLEQFDAEVEKILPLAREEPYRSQLARLDQLGQLRKIFRDAILASVRKLSAGETFKVMNTSVAFVEGTDEYIIIKIGGNNEKHSLRELPLGLGLGLADLSLDSEAGTDVAARGVYCFLLPKQTSVSQREGKKFLSKAIESGKVRADLLSVFEERYE